jgi:hypothetical protein
VSNGNITDPPPTPDNSPSRRLHSAPGSKPNRYSGRGDVEETTAAALQGVATVLYTYDGNDHLLAESDASGPIRSYVWRDDTPVAQIDHWPSRHVLYLESDHLNTPEGNRGQTMVFRLGPPHPRAGPGDHPELRLRRQRQPHWRPRRQLRLRPGQYPNTARRDRSRSTAPATPPPRAALPTPGTAPGA